VGGIVNNPLLVKFLGVSGDFLVCILWIHFATWGCSLHKNGSPLYISLLLHY